LRLRATANKNAGTSRRFCLEKPSELQDDAYTKMADAFSIAMQ
jgi:hypothetical protein